MDGKTVGARDPRRPDGGGRAEPGLLAAPASLAIESGEGPVVQKKICLLGAHAVGKSSLVARFLEAGFSEEYRTTVGAHLERKDLVVDATLLRLLIWDLHGHGEHQRVREACLRGAAGCLLVVDGTRGTTLKTVLRLRTRVWSVLGRVPLVIAVNKSDLADDCVVDRGMVQRMSEPGIPVFTTSAHAGYGVEDAFRCLARLMLRFQA